MTRHQKVRAALQEPSEKSVRLAVSVVIVENDRFLLVERANEPGRGTFAFPGGKVETGESLEAAIKRELLEETALSLHAMDLLEIMPVTTPSGDYLLHVFLATDYSGTPQAGDDAASYGWYRTADMDAMPVPQSVRDIASKFAQV